MRVIPGQPKNHSLKSTQKIARTVRSALFYSFRANYPIFAAGLTIAEDKPIRANRFFLNQVVDNCIYPVPAQLLSSLARFAITDNGDLAARVVAYLDGSGSQKRHIVLAQRNPMTLKRDAGQITDTAILLRLHIGQRIPQVLTTLRIRALSNPICIHRLADCRRNL